MKNKKSTKHDDCLQMFSRIKPVFFIKLQFFNLGWNSELCMFRKCPFRSRISSDVRSCTCEASDQWMRCVTFGHLLSANQGSFETNTFKRTWNEQNWEFCLWSHSASCQVTWLISFYTLTILQQSFWSKKKINVKHFGPKSSIKSKANSCLKEFNMQYSSAVNSKTLALLTCIVCVKLLLSS